MELFEKLYEKDETAKVRFVGLTTDTTRYDFGFIYTSFFFAKPLVVCMQTGRSAILDPKDLDDIEYLQLVFKIKDPQQAKDLADFLFEALPDIPDNSQYL